MLMALKLERVRVAEKPFMKVWPTYLASWPLYIVYVFVVFFYLYNLFTSTHLRAPALQKASPLQIANCSQFAYVTLLSSNSFLSGTLVLIESLRITSTTHDIIVMILPHISKIPRDRLFKMGAKVLEVDYFVNPYTSKMISLRQLDNFAKLRSWQMIEYERIVVLGTFILVRL